MSEQYATAIPVLDGASFQPSSRGGRTLLALSRNAFLALSSRISGTPAPETDASSGAAAREKRMFMRLDVSWDD